MHLRSEADSLHVGKHMSGTFRPAIGDSIPCARPLRWLPAIDIRPIYRQLGTLPRPAQFVHSFSRICDPQLRSFFVRCSPRREHTVYQVIGYRDPKQFPNPTSQFSKTVCFPGFVSVIGSLVMGICLKFVIWYRQYHRRSVMSLNRSSS